MEQKKDMNPSLSRSALKDVSEFTQEEQVGLMTVLLNEKIRDRLSLEILFRDKKSAFEKNGNQNNNIQYTETQVMLKETDEEIGRIRVVIQELKDKKLVI